MKAGRRWTSEAGIDEWSRDRPPACEGMHAVRPQYQANLLISGSSYFVDLEITTSRGSLPGSQSQGFWLPNNRAL